MKFFVSTLINESIALIREACSSEVIYFLSYLREEDIERVSIKLWDLFLSKLNESSEPSVLRSHVTKLFSLLNNDRNINEARKCLTGKKIGNYELNDKDLQRLLVAFNSQ